MCCMPEGPEYIGCQYMYIVLSVGRNMHTLEDYILIKGIKDITFTLEDYILILIGRIKSSH